MNKTKYSDDLPPSPHTGGLIDDIMRGMELDESVRPALTACIEKCCSGAKCESVIFAKSPKYPGIRLQPVEDPFELLHEAIVAAHGKQTRLFMKDVDDRIKRGTKEILDQNKMILVDNVMRHYELPDEVRSTISWLVDLRVEGIKNLPQDVKTFSDDINDVYRQNPLAAAHCELRLKLKAIRKKLDATPDEDLDDPSKRLKNVLQVSPAVYAQQIDQGIKLAVTLESGRSL